MLHDKDMDKNDDHSRASLNNAYKFIGEYLYVHSKIENKLNIALRNKNSSPFLSHVSGSPEEKFLKVLKRSEIQSVERGLLYKAFCSLCWVRNDLAHNICTIKIWSDDRFAFWIQSFNPINNKSPHKKYVERIERLTGVALFYKVPPEKRPDVRREAPHEITYEDCTVLLETAHKFLSLLEADSFFEYLNDDWPIPDNTHHLIHWNPIALHEIGDS